MLRRFFVTLCAASLFTLGCGDDSGGGGGGGDGGGGGTDGGGGTVDTGPLPYDANVSPDGPIQSGETVQITENGVTRTCRTLTCAGHLTECGDCVDNDEDGLFDDRDPECLGPCDNTEGPALTTGVGGEGGASCNRDCYFDFGNGSGNDECRWDTLCDPNGPDAVCPYDADEAMDPGSNRCLATQPAMCLEVCRPLTPNGCDCFGCCTFDEIADRADADGGAWVWLGSGIGEGPDGAGTCTFDLIDDTEACKPCEPVDDCFNDCGECELCIGRETLPDYCTPPAPMDGAMPPPDAYVPPPRCPGGEQPCGLPDDPDCPVDTYCITGCCQPILI